MKQSYFFAIFLSLLLAACHQSDKNIYLSKKLAEEKLKGRVKTVMHLSWVAKEIDGVPTRVGLDAKSLETYDEKGNMIEEIIYDDNDTRKVIDSFIYTYNTAGQIAKTIRYLSGGTVYAYYEYLYDSSGNLKEDTRYFDNGKKHTRNTYKYSGHNQMEHRIFVYKEYNNSVEEKVIRFVYNKKGQMIESKAYAKDRLTYSSTFYDYDSYGNVIDKRWKWDNGEEHRDQISYDKEGNEIKTTSTSPGKTYSYKYVYNNYDKASNWQTQSLVQENTVTQIFDREMTYY